MTTLKIMRSGGKDGCLGPEHLHDRRAVYMAWLPELGISRR